MVLIIIGVISCVNGIKKLKRLEEVDIEKSSLPKRLHFDGKKDRHFQQMEVNSHVGSL